MTDGIEYSERQQTMTSTDSTSSEEMPLHEKLAKHLETCSECQTTLAKRPTGFGSTSELCSDYQSILLDWANREGWVNNIVDHDEFGNKASETVHENYPTQWRLYFMRPMIHARRSRTASLSNRNALPSFARLSYWYLNSDSLSVRSVITGY
jgi:hypothetical protein